jgi:NADPH:quinone reductase-like Zn-dependent oxidoreductase
VTLPLPCVPGSEVVGRVTTAGPGTSLLPGDRVVGLVRWPDGGFAESAAMAEGQVFLLPEDLPAPVAACMGNYVTAHLTMHRRAAVRADDVVVVPGAAGGVGEAAVRLAKHPDRVRAVNEQLEDYGCRGGPPGRGLRRLPYLGSLDCGAVRSHSP